MTTGGSDRGLYPVVAYIATLTVLILGYFFPNMRVWGVNWWHHFGPVGLGVLLAVAVSGGFAVWRYLPELKSKEHSVSSGTAWSIAIISAAVVIPVFLAGRTATHFLGDGYALINTTAQAEPYIKIRNFGGQIVIYLLSMVTAERSGSSVLAAYRVVSVAAGFVFVTATVQWALRSYRDYTKALLFALGVISGGYVLQFFGYVENYALFVLVVLLFTLSGIRAANAEGIPWWPIALAVIGSVIHVFGLALIPAAAYLGLRNTQFGRRVGKLNRVNRRLLLLLGGMAGAAAFLVYYLTDFRFRNRFMPLWDDFLTADGYWLLSVSHLADVANLAIVLTPGLLVLVAAIIANRSPHRKTSPEGWFLALLTICCWSVVFLIDPKLGMARDWDLMAFAGVVSTVALFRWCLESKAKHAIAAAGLAVVAGLLLQVPRVIAFTDAEMGYDRFVASLERDRARSRTSYQTLTDYLAAEGRFQEADAAAKKYEAKYVERKLVTQTRVMASDGRWSEMITMNHRARQLNPLYSSSYVQLGVAFSGLRRPDSSLYYLTIADALRPDDPTIHLGIGLAHRSLGDLKQAKDHLWTALSIDSTQSNSMGTLIEIYAQERRRDSAAACLVMLAGNQSAEATLFENLVDMLNRAGYRSLAAQAESEARARRTESR